MATPSSAYTYPAYASRPGPVLPPMHLRVPLALPESTICWLPVMGPNLANAFTKASPVSLAPTLFRVPPPPMGRQIAVTLPPVYKERGGGDDATGRIFPRRTR